MSGFNLKVWASAPTTFGWRIGNSGEPPQKRFQLGNIVPGTPVLAKHSKSFSLIDCISVGVDRMQRNFEPMRKQVETWQRSELTDVTAKVVIYEGFVEGRLEAPKHLARTESRSTRNSGRERSGVSPMRSRQHSRNWIPFHSSGDGQAGRIPRSPVLSIVLARGLRRPPASIRRINAPPD
jgi:hypothetical protein